MSEIARLQVDILKRQLDELERLQELGGLRSKRELWDTAFTLLKWAVKKRVQGVAVGSLSAEGIFKELEMPFLEDYAANARKEIVTHSGNTPEEVNIGNVATKPAHSGSSSNAGIHLTKKRRTA